MHFRKHLSLGPEFSSLIILFESLRLVEHIYTTSFGYYLCQGLSLLSLVEINYINVYKL